MTRDPERPRAADAPTTTTKAPIRGPSSFLGVSTFLALVFATGGTPAEASEYVYRARLVPIEAASTPAPEPVPGAAEWVGGVLVLRPGVTYATGRTYDAIIRDGSTTIHALGGMTFATMRNDASTRPSAAALTTYNWLLGQGYMTKSLDERLAPFGVRVSARGDGFALRVGTGTPGVWITTSSPSGETLLRVLDLREVTP